MVAIAQEPLRTQRKRYRSAMADPSLVMRAIVDSFCKLDPRTLIKNPVIFVTAVVSALVTVLFIRDLLTGQPAAFSSQIAAWLWFTVLFANFAEAIAEGRGRAQADALRRTRTETRAKRLLMPGRRDLHEGVEALQLRSGAAGGGSERI
jgi:potassium-transporting ATPase ATP-binding subunit